LTETSAEAIARLYDLDLSVEPGDVDLYRALARRTGGPILELAVGSGRIAVPLAEDDKDVVLDLQAAFTRCWDDNPYPALLRYDGPPPGRLTPEEVRWCEDMLRQAGLRPPPPAQPS